MNDPRRVSLWECAAIPERNYYWTGLGSHRWVRHRCVIRFWLIDVRLAMGAGSITGTVSDRDAPPT